jgi:hypothetical protein
MRTTAALFVAVVLAAAPPAPTGRVLCVPVRTAQAVEGAGAPTDPHAWKAAVSGAPAEVRRVLGPGDDLMLLLVSDLTGDLTRAETAKDALLAEIRQMPPQVWVGLLRAQDGLRVLVDPTADREIISAGIQSLTVSGRPGLLESIHPAASLASGVRSKANVRVAVFYLTDSDVSNSREDFSNPVINESDRRDMSRRFPDALIRERIAKLETALGAVEAPVFILHLAYRTDRLNVAYQSGLMRLASATGGDSLFCRSQNEIPEAVSRMLGAVQSHYSLEIPLPPAAPRQLDVNLACDQCSLAYRTRFRN